MTFIKTILKAIAAGLVVIAGAIAADQINAEPWVEGVLLAIIAAVTVYVVPNIKPTE